MPVVIVMQPTQFNSVIRYVKNASLEKVKALQHEIRLAMDRLELIANPKQAVPGIPDGSDQSNPQNLFTWARKIKSENKYAKRQLIAIDATITKRIDL